MQPPLEERAMQMCRVLARSERHKKDDDSYPVVVIAEGVVEAEALAKAMLRTRGFTIFTGELIAEGLDGPARPILW
jgi:hypothetical protein